MRRLAGAAALLAAAAVALAGCHVPLIVALPVAEQGLGIGVKAIELERLVLPAKPKPPPPDEFQL